MNNTLNFALDHNRWNTGAKENLLSGTPKESQPFDHIARFCMVVKDSSISTAFQDKTPKELLKIFTVIFTKWRLPNIWPSEHACILTQVEIRVEQLFFWTATLLPNLTRFLTQLNFCKRSFQLGNIGRLDCFESIVFLTN